jgi:hypothetical protein
MPYRQVIVRGMRWMMPVALMMVAAGNWRSLREGVRYLWHMLTWRPSAVEPIASDGPFGNCYELVQGDNAARCQLITDTLRTIGLGWEEIPVPQEAIPDLFIQFGPDGPTTLFVAHYDKSRETPTYQGAADNTAAVSVLLAAARDLVTRPPTRPVAFLFTAAEERGLKGARAFLDWSRDSNVAIAEVINLDMLGRGILALRPSALPGFYFWLPLFGLLVFDGRRLRRGASYPLPDQALVR